jgi:hypothetical protein
MLTFCVRLQSINEAASVRSKFGLYPPGYDGIGLYPLGYYIPASADVITYMAQSDLNYYGYEGHPFGITHLKGNISPHGETKLPGKVVEPRDTDMPGKVVEPKDTSMPGKIVKPTQWFKQPDFPKQDTPRRKSGKWTSQ